MKAVFKTLITLHQIFVSFGIYLGFIDKSNISLYWITKYFNEFSLCEFRILCTVCACINSSWYIKVLCLFYSFAVFLNKLEIYKNLFTSFSPSKINLVFFCNKQTICHFNWKKNVITGNQNDFGMINICF